MTGTLNFNAPDDVRWIAQELQNNGYEAWAVGGAVRDAMLGHTPGDWDLTTNARPEEVMRIFPRTAPVGLAHGTVGVVAKDGTMYEVTTYRRDVNPDGRHTDVEFAQTLEEDLSRRDFTINAAAWNPITLDLYDPHDAYEDLRQRRLRTVGTPEDRFAEDRLRVLRAFRFAGRYGLKPDSSTWRAAFNAVDDLTQLSVERVREELLKVLKSPHPSGALKWYARSGALHLLYPEITNTLTTARVWPALVSTVDSLGAADHVLRFSALMLDVPTPDLRALLLRLKCSTEQMEGTITRVEGHRSYPAEDATDSQLRRWIRSVGRDALYDVFKLRECRMFSVGEDYGAAASVYVRAHRLQHAPMSVRELQVGGADLQALGMIPGPGYGRVLNALLERVTDDPTLDQRATLRQIAVTYGFIE